MTKARDLANASTALSAVTATELGYVDGVTSAIQTQLDGKQAVNANVSTTELGYLDGVTSAVQTQLDAKIAKTLTTTTGDIIYASAANTPARLGIGTTGQVLNVTGGVPAWVTASAAGDNFTLLNPGGTALSGTTTTVSGISGKGTICVFIQGGGVSVSSQTRWQFRINGDTGGNYLYSLAELASTASYSSNNLTSYAAWGDDGVAAGTSGSAGTVSGGITILGCNSSGVKPFSASGSGNYSSSGQQKANWAEGVWNSASTVTSVSIYASGNTMNAGTVYVYASA